MNGYIVVGTVIVVLILIYVVIRIRRRNAGSTSSGYSYQNNYGSNSLRDRAQGALGKLGDCCVKGIGKLFRGGA